MTFNKVPTQSKAHHNYYLESLHTSSSTAFAPFQKQNRSLNAIHTQKKITNSSKIIEKLISIQSRMDELQCATKKLIKYTGV